MNLRNATKDDAPQLIPLLIQLDAKYKMSINAMIKRIEAFNAKGDLIIVAEEDAKIAGVVAFSFYEQFRLPGKCCHIDSLVVDKNLRGKGLGKLLVQVVEEYAAQRDTVTIELTSSNYRKEHGTHAFYESLGYKSNSTLDCCYFAKSLQPKPVNDALNKAAAASSQDNALSAGSIFNTLTRGQSQPTDVPNKEKEQIICKG